jgi:hypothetical protein
LKLSNYATFSCNARNALFLLPVVGPFEVACAICGFKRFYEEKTPNLSSADAALRPTEEELGKIGRGREVHIKK